MAMAVPLAFAGPEGDPSEKIVQVGHGQEPVSLPAAVSKRAGVLYVPGRDRAGRSPCRGDRALAHVLLPYLGANLVGPGRAARP